MKINTCLLFFAFVALLCTFNVEAARYSYPLSIHGHFAWYRDTLVLTPSENADVSCADRAPGSMFILPADEQIQSGLPAGTLPRLFFCASPTSEPRQYDALKDTKPKVTSTALDIPKIHLLGQEITLQESENRQTALAIWKSLAHNACWSEFGPGYRAGTFDEFILFHNGDISLENDITPFFNGSNPNYLASTGDGALFVSVANQQTTPSTVPLSAVFGDNNNARGFAFDCVEALETCSDVGVATQGLDWLENLSELPFDQFPQKAPIFCVSDLDQGLKTFTNVPETDRLKCEDVYGPVFGVNTKQQINALQVKGVYPRINPQPSLHVSGSRGIAFVAGASSSSSSSTSEESFTGGGPYLYSSGSTYGANVHVTHACVETGSATLYAQNGETRSIGTCSGADVFDSNNAITSITVPRGSTGQGDGVGVVFWADTNEEVFLGIEPFSQSDSNLVLRDTCSPVSDNDPLLCGAPTESTTANIGNGCL
eukprot:CAMPEP_0201550940 /NCGR_PEP_ID=MMETSP0173_2-20130828/7204_1 /ASSEMBLY_ACC=CAM_ASM_000268 /TAXON_ID=218659 /ORGANISM="Vexillifera sp., Strain DIVA3 564/2" /LENGTH=484 /DNA_ID=CAMNT_0047961061 /DNA_START=113 /DNA_END=1567 /DNA_ORIENTATION=-